MSGEFDEIRGRLEAIAEELADLAIIRLRESIDAGGTELPVDEKRLTRARRASPAGAPEASVSTLGRADPRRQRARGRVVGPPRGSAARRR